jgi:hypothetical protein
LCVEIYECERNGGYEWVMEDKINIKKIKLNRIKVDNNMDIR